MNTKWFACCDCGLDKPDGEFHRNSRTGKPRDYCKACGVIRKLAAPPVRRSRWNKPNTTLSILNK